MSEGTATGELFEEAVALVLGRPDVSLGSGFGSVPGVRVGRKVFAMLCRGELVVKLPEHRVDELDDTGAGTRFDPRGDGRRMREWASIPPALAAQWPGLVEEARAFVESLQRRGHA